MELTDRIEELLTERAAVKREWQDAVERAGDMRARLDEIDDEIGD